MLHDTCRACTHHLTGRFSGLVYDQLVLPFMKIFPTLMKSVYFFRFWSFFIAALVNQTLTGQHVVPLMYRLLPNSHSTNITASSQLQEIDPLCSCFPWGFSYHPEFQLTAVLFTVKSLYYIKRPLDQKHFCVASYNVLTGIQMFTLILFSLECRRNNSIMFF